MSGTKLALGPGNWMSALRYYCSTWSEVMDSLILGQWLSQKGYRFFAWYFGRAQHPSKEELRNEDRVMMRASYRDAYGRALTDVALSTRRTLEHLRLLKPRELRLAALAKFIHPNGFIDVDFVLLRINCTLAVTALSVFAVLNVIAIIAFAMMIPDVQSTITTAICSVVVLAGIAVVVVITLHLSYCIFVLGVMPLLIAQSLYDQRDVIEREGPRCVFVGSALSSWCHCKSM